ncbi:hypothetical protein RQP46_004119 [Phenoliferia psychrophenolica]
MPTHVDDLLGASNDPALWNETIEKLSQRLTFSKNEWASLHLGSLIQVAADGSIYVSQPSYIEDFAASFGLADAKSVRTPMAANTTLSPDEDGAPLTSITHEEFLEGVGKMQWIFASSHPEIAVLTRSLGRFVHAPRESHWLALKHGIRYLLGVKNFGLCFRYDGKDVLVKSDSDWAGLKQLALSSAEAEFYAASTAIKRAIPIVALGEELGVVDPNVATSLEMDNTAAITMLGSQNINQKSRHIDIRYNYVRKMIRDGRFEPSYVPSADNPADIFTKALGPDKFFRARELVGVVDVEAELDRLGRSMGGVRG